MKLSRDLLLQQRKEKEAALKELSEKYKDPTSIKYDLFNEDGNNAGYIEYSPQNDVLFINNGSPVHINGKILKSLRDTLNKSLDE